MNAPQGSRGLEHLSPEMDEGKKSNLRNFKLSLYKFPRLVIKHFCCINIYILVDIKQPIRPKKKKSLIALSPLKKNGSVGGIFFFFNLFIFFINTIFECKMRPEFLMKVS